MPMTSEGWDALLQQPGFKGVMLLSDLEAGTGFAIVLWDSLEVNARLVQVPSPSGDPSGA